MKINFTSKNPTSEFIFHHKKAPQDIKTDFFKSFYAQTILKHSSVACHCLQIVFAFSQYPKWLTYDGKAMLSYPGVTHARFALVIVAG